MATPSAITTAAMIPTTPNFLGMLFRENVKKTQFLSAIGGIDGTNALFAPNIEFPLSVNYKMNNGSAPNISEDASMKIGTINTYVKAQTMNITQIFQYFVSVSRYRENAYGRLSGLNTAGQYPEIESEIGFQLDANLEQMKIDMNYTALNGVYSNAGNTSSANANKTGGLISGITTNVIDGEGKQTDEQITETIDTLIKTVYDVAPFDTPTLIVNSTNKMVISKAYKSVGYVEVDRNRFVAGVDIQQLVTNFGKSVYIMIDNDVPNDVVLLADLRYIRPVFNVDRETGNIIVVKPLSQAGGATYELYSAFGLDYGCELCHGKITNFNTAAGG